MRLDKKKRLVLPLIAREKLGITDSVDVTFAGDSIVITPPGEGNSRPISKNCMEITKRKVVGILGGMDPEATADLYLRIIRICQKLGAKQSKDYPPMVFYNVSTPDTITNNENEDSLLRCLDAGTRALERAGADAIAVPCNTATYAMRKIKLNVPLISIIDEVVKASQKFKCVGLLATPTTIGMGVYQRALEKDGVKTLVPSTKEQIVIEQCIREVLKGKKTQAQKERLKSIIKGMDGTDAVILGCTELPLILKQEDCDIPIIDSLQILAEAIVEETNGSSGVTASIVGCGPAGAGSTPASSPRKKVM